MPLKHDTETWLLLLLAFIVVLTGAVTAFLPPIAFSPLPWVIAFFLSLAYPLVLYPFLKNRRADYEFRILHFAPAFMLLLWLVLDLLASYRPSTAFLHAAYTRGWSVLIVSVLFTMLLLFVLHVIRQRTARIGMLLILFLPYLLLAQWSERRDWDRAVTAWLLQPESQTGAVTGTGIIAGTTSSNLAPSESPEEERWRMRLRILERRRRRIERVASAPSSGVASSSILRPTVVAAVRGAAQAGAGRKGFPNVAPPPRLASSGPEEWGMLILLLAAGYCASLHRKTMQRLLSASTIA